MIHMQFVLWGTRTKPIYLNIHGIFKNEKVNVFKLETHGCCYSYILTVLFLPKIKLNLSFKSAQNRRPSVNHVTHSLRLKKEKPTTTHRGWMWADVFSQFPETAILMALIWPSRTVNTVESPMSSNILFLFKVVTLPVFPLGLVFFQKFCNSQSGLK